MLKPLINSDIIVGIPCLNTGYTIGNVIEKVAHGISEYFPNHSAIIMISDGYSNDDTREKAAEANIPDNIKKIISLYTGINGKGTAIKNILQVAKYLEVSSCCIIDSDLRSISPKWMDLLINPVLKDELDIIFPLYYRHKFDASITNHFIYPFMRALYGYEIRQPIGGDIGLSSKAIEYYLQTDTWEPDIAKYGIDIWMTTLAIIGKLRMGQAALGVKIHDAKDPSIVLAPMFRQVLGTCFNLAARYVDKWIKVKEIKTLPLVGNLQELEPQPISSDYEILSKKFFECYPKHRLIWEKYLSQNNIEYIRHLRIDQEQQRLSISDHDWARLIYDFFISYKKYNGHETEILESMTSLYFLKVIDYKDKVMEKNLMESLRVIHEEAEVFFQEKPYLVDKWTSEIALTEPVCKCP
jgi:glycosyltransferase involved in cell wall biosynthesis